MKAAAVGFGLTTGGMALALATLGVTVDLALGAPLAQAAISSDTEVTGLTLAGLFTVAVVAFEAVRRGTLAIIRTTLKAGEMWRAITEGLKSAKELAVIVAQMKEQVEKNGEQIAELNEWRSTVDSEYTATDRKATNRTQ